MVHFGRCHCLGGGCPPSCPHIEPWNRAYQSAGRWAFQSEAAYPTCQTVAGGGPAPKPASHCPQPAGGTGAGRLQHGGRGGAALGGGRPRPPGPGGAARRGWGCRRNRGGPHRLFSGRGRCQNAGTAGLRCSTGGGVPAVDLAFFLCGAC